jgi:putative ABC transport system permease protein
MKKPPRIAEKLLKYFLGKENSISRFRDFEEVFYDIAENTGLFRAQKWYWKQVIISIPNLIINSIFWSITMFKNYLLTSFRNIKKHKSFTVINISGLAIGMACCILLAIYINSELSFDNYHVNANRIYRVGQDVSFNNFTGRSSATNGVIAEALEKNYPEVEATTRFSYLYTSIMYKDKQFNDRFYYSDKPVFNIFTWPFIQGDPKTALSAPYSIVLTKETANKYFGNEDPIGKTLLINENEEFKVTGVIEDIPKYSTLRFKGLLSFSTLYARSKEPDHLLTDWMSHNFRTFVLLKKDVDYKEFENKIKNIYYNYIEDELIARGANYKVFLQPLKDIYLRPIDQKFGPIVYVYIFSAVALFILLIACVNFMNLSTARSMTRSIEVGVRKVFGANRNKLINQFLTETLLLSTISMILAVGIVYIFLPVISEFAQRDLSQDFPGFIKFIPGFIGIVIFVGLVAGSYPALFLSKFEPAQVIKEKSKSVKSNILFRRMLVLTQFVISITLIIGTALVIQQLDYLKNKDTGFNKEHVVCLSVRDQVVRQQLPVLKEKIKNLPEVINTGAASNLPGWGAALNAKIPEGYSVENTQLMLEVNVDDDFLSTMEIDIISGRNFSKEFAGDPRSSVIINETAAKRYGWDQPIGKIIKTLNIDKPNEKEFEDRKVIGVIKDYHLSGLSSQIEPAFIANVLDFPFPYGRIRVLAIRIKPGSTSSVLSKIEHVWKDIFPDKPFNYYFMDEDFNEQFISIERSRDILSYFTFLAIFISCLGLFGMASYLAEKRTKEIGIRKVLGCSVSKIIALLSKELIYIILVANIIAYPLAYFTMNQWFQDFPYRIDINYYTFIFSTILALVISLVTVSYQSIKASIANPIHALKYE